MSTRNYSKRLIIETPPPKGKRGRPATNHQFLERIEREAPNQWVRWGLRVKSPGGISALAKHPRWAGRVEVTTRRNTDRTFGVWVRVKPNQP